MGRQVAWTSPVWDDIGGLPPPVDRNPVSMGVFSIRGEVQLKRILLDVNPVQCLHLLEVVEENSKDFVKTLLFKNTCEIWCT